MSAFDPRGKYGSAGFPFQFAVNEPKIPDDIPGMLGAVIVDTASNTAKPARPTNEQDQFAAIAMQRYLDGEFSDPVTALFTAKQEQGHTEWEGVPIQDILDAAAEENAKEETPVCGATVGFMAQAARTMAEHFIDLAIAADDFQSFKGNGLVAMLLAREAKRFASVMPEGEAIPSFRYFHKALFRDGYSCPEQASGREPDDDGGENLTEENIADLFGEGPGGPGEVL